MRGHLILLSDAGADAIWQTLVKVCEAIAIIIADACIDARWQARVKICEGITILAADTCIDARRHTLFTYARAS